ncbi:MAG: bifunctional glutamate N-acetyltransferase/amino-acid acetyltransferase ArgJ [Candidatus Omnitrophota bacterium]
MKITKGGITQAKGFKANGIWCGIKRSKKEDLSLVVSDHVANTACVFTKNSIVAAPLTVCKKHLKNNKAQAVIVNSGNANCFTGKSGYRHAEKMTELTAASLNIKVSDVLVTSTGIIGKPLPIEHVESGMRNLVDGLSNKGGTQFAKGILTTDTTLKEKSVQIKIGSSVVNIGGCCKGSGMIAPNMATMLGFITTDAAISPKLLKIALKKATEESFNCITVDGCMSTNDMVVLMANGQAGNTPIMDKGNEFDLFCKTLTFVCCDLAKKIVLDGEGATKFVKIQVKGAKTHKQAKDIGLMIANSMLVKTAIYGSNPNWGRVAAAVGALGIKQISEDQLKIDFSSFKKKNVSITTTLNIGNASATVFTSDLSHEYIRINTEYT